MTTVIQQMLDWQHAHQGQIEYSETAPTRLASDTEHMLSPTDCSGLVARLMAHFAGLNVGTYTGNECAFGQLITLSKDSARNAAGMRPGDVILFDWDGGAWDHIAMYAGDGRIWNHGGPGPGPQNWSLAENVDAAVKVMVRRFVTDTTPDSSTGGFTMDAEAAARFDRIEKQIAALPSATWAHGIEYPDPATGHPATKPASLWLTYGSSRAGQALAHVKAKAGAIDTTAVAADITSRVRASLAKAFGGRA